MPMPDFSLLYSFPYLAVLFMLFILWRCDQGRVRICYLLPRNICENVALFILLIFIGLRGHISSDFVSYYPWFQILPNLSKLEFNTLFDDEFEFGFILYSSVIKTIFTDYFVWVFINTLVDMLILMWAFKRYSCSVVLSFFFFVAFNGVIMEFNLYRNTKSFSLFLLSLPYLQNRKLLPYLLLNMTGCLFHISSMIYLPLYFVLYRKMSKKIIWTSYFIVNTLIFMNIHFTSDIMNLVMDVLDVDRVSRKIVGYMSNGEDLKLSFGWFERSFSFCLFMLNYDKLTALNKMNRVFCDSFFFYYISFHLFMDIQVLVERIPSLFMYSYWFLYPATLHVITTKYKNIIVVAVMLLCFVKTTLANREIICRYDNLITGIESFEKRASIRINMIYKQ